MPKSIPSVSENFEFNNESTTVYQPPDPHYTSQPEYYPEQNSQNYYNNGGYNQTYQENSSQGITTGQNNVDSVNSMQIGGNDFSRGGSFNDGFNGGNISIQDLGNIELFDLIQMLIVYSFIIAGFLAAAFIFVGGISFILSGGDDEKIKKAVNTIRYSIIGLIVTILSFTFITIIGKIFNLDLLKYISWKSIKVQIDRVLPDAPTENTGDFQIRR